MTTKEIDELIENNYELIWEMTHIEKNGGDKVVSRPVKIITVPSDSAKEMYDYVREQKLGYRIFTRNEDG